LLAALGGRHPTATVLAIADSRRLVRAAFLSSAAESGLLRLLRNAATAAELAAECGAARTDRLEAWLAVGVELGELARRGNRYKVVGPRARALRDGDPLLTAHYRSMLEYQVGPYREVRELLSQGPSAGRDDLSTHARTIAEVSLAAAPFVVPFLRRAVGSASPASALDVGCGTGVYLRALLEADPLIRVEGIELSPDVAAATAAGLVADGLAERATVRSGDVRELDSRTAGPFGLVTLCNNIYYFAPEERLALYRQLGSLLAPGGTLLVTTMTTPGSTASAHLHFMLSCQAGAAGLPRQGEIEQDLARAGLEVVDAQRLVPTEPFVGIAARRRDTRAGGSAG
jgi:SAM-dependent methyltransferase